MAHYSEDNQHSDGRDSEASYSPKQKNENLAPVSTPPVSGQDWPKIDFDIVLNRYSEDETETTLSEYIKGIEDGIDPDDEQERLDYLKLFSLEPGETLTVGLDNIWRPATPVSGQAGNELQERQITREDLNNASEGLYALMNGEHEHPLLVELGGIFLRDETNIKKILSHYGISPERFILVRQKDCKELAETLSLFAQDNGKLKSELSHLREALKEVSPVLDGLINRTPSGKQRNELCDMNIKVKNAIIQ